MAVLRPSSDVISALAPELAAPIFVRAEAAVDAFVPPFATGSTPDTPDVRLIGGISAATRSRKAGVPDDPLGPENMKFPLVVATPVPPLAAGRTPVTPPLPEDAMFITGTSALAIVRKTGVPDDPFGAAKNMLGS